MPQRHYITTAIDYPNAAPHMGHVLEKVMADVYARWQRLQGNSVRFQVGTDEHGIKIQRKAEEEGVTPQELVDRNVPLFQELYDTLGISYDVFVRTSDKERHWPTVIALWKKLRDSGHLEKRSYTGLYCSGCERFMTKRDLVDGLCPDHQKAPEEVTEENWFFSMSKYGDELKKLLTDSWDGESYRILPEFRANETLSLIEQGLEDVSFSRPTSSLSWGVPVPDDDRQTMYVWCDALTNYISTLGFFTAREEREWWDDATVTHVIGKDIARFHALIWPLMLKLAGEKTPDTLLTHGFLTSEGKKMSKSLGNVVVPSDVIEKYGIDALRFYLSNEIPVGNDGDFSWERFSEVYDSELRNTLGNLLNRVLVMLKKIGGEVTTPESWDIATSWNAYDESFTAFGFQRSLEQTMKIARLGNQRFNEIAPWKIEDEATRRARLSEFAELLRHISLMLLPFMPGTAQKISRQLGVPYAEEMLKKEFMITPEMRQWGGVQNWTQVGEPEILFAPVETA